MENISLGNVELELHYTKRVSWMAVVLVVAIGLLPGILARGQAAIPLKQVVADPKDDRCLSDTTADPIKIGTLKFKGISDAENELAAKIRLLEHIAKFVKESNCNINHPAGAVRKLAGGTVTIGKDGIKVPPELKEKLSCSRNNDAKNQCATMCQKTGTQCTTAFKPGHCTVVAKDIGKGAKGLRRFEMEADCDVYANVTAQCKCASTTGCYAFRGNGEIGPDDKVMQGEDEVMCVCPSEGEAKKKCPVFLAALCKKGEKLMGGDAAVARGDKWTMNGTCAKEVSTTDTPEPTPTFTATPIPPTEEPTPTITPPTLVTPTPTATITPIMETPTATPTVIMTPITSTPTTTPPVTI